MNSTDHENKLSVEVKWKALGPGHLHGDDPSGGANYHETEQELKQEQEQRHENADQLTLFFRLRSLPRSRQRRHRPT